MDFKSYYLNQALGNNSYPVFKGPTFQRGYGLGGIFRRFFTWALPIIRENLAPTAKSVGKELISGVSNTAIDAIHGKDVETSAKNRFREAVKNLGGHVGSGYKRKRKRNLKLKNKKQKVLDIFD